MLTDTAETLPAGVGGEGAGLTGETREDVIRARPADRQWRTRGRGLPHVIAAREHMHTQVRTTSHKARHQP